MRRLSGFQNGLIAVYARILAAANTKRAVSAFAALAAGLLLGISLAASAAGRRSELPDGNVVP